MILSKNKIDYIRADRGMTLRDIAKAGKTSTRTINAARHGEEVAVMAAGRIAKALNVPVEYLAISGDEHNEKSV